MVTDKLALRQVTVVTAVAVLLLSSVSPTAAEICTVLVCDAGAGLQTIVIVARPLIDGKLVAFVMGYALAFANVQTIGEVPLQVHPVPVNAEALTVTPAGSVSVTVTGLEPKTEGTLASVTSVACV